MNRHFPAKFGDTHLFIYSNRWPWQFPKIPPERYGVQPEALSCTERESGSLRNGHDRVAAVYNTGPALHPQHALARTLMAGFSGMLSFELNGGSRKQDEERA